LAKIAIDLEQALERRRRNGSPGRMTSRLLASGDEWGVADVICTSGPQDRPYDERHAGYAIAIVLAGSFQYRSGLGRALMTPGSVMLANDRLCFECGHEHGEGDRCVSFTYAPEYFERLAADAGVRGIRAGFNVPRLPPTAALSLMTVRAGLGASGSGDVAWDELALRLAVSAMRLASGASPDSRPLPANAEARVTRTVRRIDRHPDAVSGLDALAGEAGLSPYHFLRTFERVTGVTPHQYLQRARLREAATRLRTNSGKVVDIALDCGFGDISNFNRAFRTEFGVSPRVFRSIP
jgi:AraC-like DNA-binding protein